MGHPRIDCKIEPWPVPLPLEGEVPAVRETVETRFPFRRVWPDPRIESSIHKKLLHRPLCFLECASGCRRV